MAHQLRTVHDLGQLPLLPLGTLAERYDLGELESITCDGEPYQVVILSDASRKPSVAAPTETLARMHART